MSEFIVVEKESFWAPRPCLLEPVDEIFAAASLLDEAVTAHLQGDADKVGELIRQADIRAIGQWSETLWGKPSFKVHRLRKPVKKLPALVDKNSRPATSLPSVEDRQAMIERDGYNCRYCGIPVIRPKLRDRIRAVYPDALRWGRLKREQHAAFQCMSLAFDHVVPLARGGDNSLRNMVICCQPCNSGKLEYMLEEVGLADPRQTPVERTEWDGLERFK